MPASDRSYRIVNLRDQPVELHVGADAVVVGPLGEAKVAVRTGQLDELARRGLITVEEIERRAPSRPRRATPSTRKPSRSGSPKGGKK